MSLRASATLAETAAVHLFVRGPGLFEFRKRRARKAIGAFLDQAMCVPEGGVLPHDVRAEVRAHIERIVDALDKYLDRSGSISAKRAVHDVGVARQIYALRAAEQHLLQTRHFR